MINEQILSVTSLARNSLISFLWWASFWSERMWSLWEENQMFIIQRVMIGAVCVSEEEDGEHYLQQMLETHWAAPHWDPPHPHLHSRKTKTSSRNTLITLIRAYRASSAILPLLFLSWTVFSVCLVFSWTLNSSFRGVWEETANTDGINMITYPCICITWNVSHLGELGEEVLVFVEGWRGWQRSLTLQP